MNYWLVAIYKINEQLSLENNLKNQKLLYYLPRITIKNNNSISKEELLFPGYIFIKTTFDNYSTLNYTKGIKKILRFGNNISCMSEKDIAEIRIIEKNSKNEPISLKVVIGQEVNIVKGPLKGSLVEIGSIPSNKRVDILLSILGTKRRVNIPVHDLVI